jgi:protein-tyrosine-phosphatase
MHRVAFICVENSNRSQMAEAFARMHGAGIIEPFSAGSRPSGRVNPRAVQAMNEVGYDLSSHRSTRVDDLPPGEFDYAITMGCGDDCPWLAAKQREDWPIPDPKDLDAGAFNTVRDEIERRVHELIARIRVTEPRSDER